MNYLGRKHLLILAVAAGILLLLAGPVLCASGGEHGGGEHGGGEHGSPGWLATDTYRVMNFAVLAIALFFLLRKPFTNALNGRIKGIREQLSELEAKRNEAEKQLAEYNQKLVQLDQEAEKIVSGYIQQGEEARARIIEAAKAAAEKLEEQAKRNIEHEFKKAKERLQAEVVEKSLAEAEALIKAKITADDQEKLVDEYLAKVVAQ